MKDSIGVGIVGYGAMYSMGKHHSAEVQGTDGMELRAIYDVISERRAAAREEQPGVTVYDTNEDLLADESVDLVVLVTPHNTHCALSVQASQADKHVMTEKVMCLNVAEADEMIKAADDVGRLLTVYQNRRWDGDFLTVQNVLLSGKLGKVFQIESCVNGFYFPDGWRGVRECGGGMLYDWGAHLCDQICTLMRPAVPVSVYAISHAGAHGVDIETQTTAMIKFDNGVSAEIDVGCMSHISRPRWLIRGEKGAFVMPDWQTATLKTADGETEVEVEPANWHAIYQNVADHLTKESPLAVSAQDVRSAMQVIDAAFASADTGEVARIGGTN
ncbi:MAG: Gfo/Idh/MocA family oxidoreductase [Armatimonadota bacterium]|nr:Gfo/Idh/MocA family oxidoreductase [Armatimonadota bacterium]